MPKRKALKIVEIPLKKIDEPGGIVRLEIDCEEIESLAKSIDEVGLINAIGVRVKGASFEIVEGHRRYLAHEMLRRENIACIVREVDDVECALIRATENLGRVDLSPLEEAAIYADLKETHGLTHDQIGKRMGISPGVVRRRLDLLKMLPSLQQAVHRKQISYSTAEEFSRLRDPERVDYYLGYAIDHGITQAVARQWVNDELKRLRTPDAGTGEGGGPTTPLEDKPIYISCDVCRGAMELGKDTVFRTCPDCARLITNAVSAGK